MGFHPLDIVILVAIALLIFGPKTLQSLSHSAGRGVSHANEIKKKVMKELPVEELSRVNETISQIPLSPQQAAHKLISSSLKSDDPKAQEPDVSSEKPALEKK